MGLDADSVGIAARVLKKLDGFSARGTGLLEGVMPQSGQVGVQLLPDPLRTLLRLCQPGFGTNDQRFGLPPGRGQSIIRVLLGGRPGAFGVLLRDAQGGLGLRPKIT